VFGRRILVLALFFVSGASGLVYELVWIRQFGTLFGSSVYSAAIVTAIYMCGLGVGAWLTARFADRVFPPIPSRRCAGTALRARDRRARGARDVRDAAARARRGGRGVVSAR
jgi:MFS family permease